MNKYIPYCYVYDRHKKIAYKIILHSRRKDCLRIGGFRDAVDRGTRALHTELGSYLPYERNHLVVYPTEEYKYSLPDEEACIIYDDIEEFFKDIKYFPQTRKINRMSYRDFLRKRCRRRYNGK